MIAKRERVKKGESLSVKDECNGDKEMKGVVGEQESGDPKKKRKQRKRRCNGRSKKTKKQRGE